MALEIIGPGFGRTGTNSLKLALEYLGFGPCHHMFEVRDHPELLPAWAAVARGVPGDWHAMFANYRSQVDWPGARCWRELIDAFPDAKVILTVREPNGWFDSVQATIAAFVKMRGKHETAHMNANADMAYELVVRGVFDDRLDDRNHAIAVFKRNIAEVQAAVAPERLLTFDVAQGWPPLCALLDVDVPDIPFPKTNSSKEFHEDEWAQE